MHALEKAHLDLPIGLLYSHPYHIYITMSSKDNILFSDIFDIKDVDGAGKKFDKGK